MREKDKENNNLLLSTMDRLRSMIAVTGGGSRLETGQAILSAGLDSGSEGDGSGVLLEMLIDAGSPVRKVLYLFGGEDLGEVVVGTGEQFVQEVRGHPDELIRPVPLDLLR